MLSIGAPEPEHDYERAGKSVERGEAILKTEKYIVF
jgi:hypothetical protein